jgi:hypothetical protein
LKWGISETGLDYIAAEAVGEVHHLGEEPVLVEFASATNLYPNSWTQDYAFVLVDQVKDLDFETALSKLSDGEIPGVRAVENQLGVHLLQHLVDLLVRRENKGAR